MKKILILVPDGSDEMEVTPFVEIPGWTKVVEDIERVDVKVAGWNDKIYMFHGMVICPDLKVDEVNIDDYDALCIPGGWYGTRYFEQVHTEIIQDMIRKAYEDDKIIATMCNGILAVGKAGLLQGKRVTSFTGECCELCRNIKERIEAEGAVFIEETMVEDGNIISNIGPAMGDEDAFHLMERLIGKEAVEKIVDAMMYNRVGKGDLKWTYERDESQKAPFFKTCGCEEK